jgi:hypothetical protein
MRLFCGHASSQLRHLPSGTSDYQSRATTTILCRQWTELADETDSSRGDASIFVRRRLSYDVYLWGVVLKIMESGSYDAQDEANLVPILVLQAIMLPLTGFLYLCIYVMPRYLRCRSDFPLLSR